MIVLGQARHLAVAATNFSLSNDMAAFEKDGEQAFVIGLKAPQRIGMIADQIRIHTPNFNFRFTFVPLVLGILGGIGPFLAEKFLKFPNPTSVKEKICWVAYQVLMLTVKASKFILQQSDKVLNLAYLINAVALVYFGFFVPGSIALVGLLALAIKRYNCLPPTLERFISPIILVSNLVTDITIPTNIVFKVIIVALDMFGVINAALNSQLIRPLLPERFTNPFYKKHVIEQREGEQKEVLEYVEFNWAFEVNNTHFFSDYVGQILATELDTSLGEIQASALFDQLTNKMQTLGIVLDDCEKAGLEDLKTCAISGSVKDVSPSDIKLFQQIIKFLVHSIIKDDSKENFMLRVKEFALVGNSCTQGWTRDITYMASPQTQDLRWAVHRVLATMRGEIIKEKIGKFYRENPRLNTAGGDNNIHLTNAVQKAFWHRFRTFEGEIDNQLYKPSFSVLLILNKFMKNKNTELSPLLELVYMSAIVFGAIPGLTSSFSLIENIENSVISSMMDQNMIVDSIYNAIKSEYVQVDGSFLKVEPKIAWPAVLSWMNQIAEKRDINIFDENTNQFDSSFVETDDQGGNNLTKAGVRLLLWDLGILSYIHL